MNEEPKSIWKKSLRGPSSFFGWLILVPCVALIACLLGAVLIDGALWKNDLDTIWIVTAICVAAIFLTLFIHWLCCWRNFKRFVFGLACFATLIGLFYAEEDWRGKHDWEKYKREWEAQGEKFDFKDFVPPPVPDNENFALSPVVFTCYGNMLTREGKEIPDQERATNFVDRMQMDIVQNYNMPKPTGLGDWAMGKTSDLKVWQNYYRTLAATTNVFPIAAQPQSPAADVLLALSKYDSTLEDLRSASQLPSSRFPLEYDKDNPSEIILPHLNALKNCSQVLQLRALSELQNGQSDQAFADVMLTLRLADSVRTEPIIIDQLVRIAIFRIALQTIWEGLAEHKWSDTQLVAFDAALTKQDFLEGAALSIRGERAMHIKLIDYLEQKRSRSSEIFGMISDANHPDNVNNSWINVGVFLMPKGWFYQNDIALSRQMQFVNLPALDVTNQMVSPNTIAQADTIVELSSLSPTPYNIFARLLTPALGGLLKKATYGQNSANLACIAIALERYQLVHGEFPESLAALAPKFIAELPHDIINGQPLKYRREADGQFILYSIGWNETDDGGVVVLSNGSAPTVDTKQGDWVWRYPR